jgi:transcriptional regulator with XRE-family HTH domain
MTDQYLIKLGKRIEALRNAQGLSLRQLEAKCKTLSHGRISEMEKGTRNPRFLTVLEVASALNVSLQDFYKGFDEIPDND